MLMLLPVLLIIVAVTAGFADIAVAAGVVCVLRKLLQVVIEVGVGVPGSHLIVGGGGGVAVQALILAKLSSRYCEGSALEMFLYLLEVCPR